MQTFERDGLAEVLSPVRGAGTDRLEQTRAALRVEPADTVGAERPIGGSRDEVEARVVARSLSERTVRFEGDAGTSRWVSTRCSHYSSPPTSRTVQPWCGTG